MSKSSFVASVSASPPGVAWYGSGRLKELENRVGERSIHFCRIVLGCSSAIPRAIGGLADD
eukprot:1489427-Pleurochrysis_carterae.AAC.3